TAVPQVMNAVPQVMNNVPHVMNNVPQVMNSVPQVMNGVPQVMPHVVPSVSMPNANVRMPQAMAPAILSPPIQSRVALPADGAGAPSLQKVVTAGTFGTVTGQKVLVGKGAQVVVREENGLTRVQNLTGTGKQV